MPPDLVLIVDDEANIVELERMYLEREGYVVKSSADGLSGLKSIKELRPALVVLDVMLPGMDGFEVCKKVRAENNQVPIIMVTARDDDFDKILGLELGADDYLTKPFNPRELVARVKAVLRRGERLPGSSDVILRAGDLEISVTRREVSCQGQLLPLRTQEFSLLQVMAEKPGRVFTREQLLSLAWGFDFYGQTRTVDVHIAQLRHKLGPSRVQIETVTGVGYKLVV